MSEYVNDNSFGNISHIILRRFMRRDNQSGPRQPGDITGPMMAQYLLALLGQGPTGRGVDPFAELFAGPEGGASSGRWGDYVFNQEGMYLPQPFSKG
jgi:E3 ubiquitin-protein ligase RNF115/126